MTLAISTFMSGSEETNSEPASAENVREKSDLGEAELNSPTFLASTSEI
jgi:hypothetical protein